MYSVERVHASSPTLSTGYADIARDFFPLGRFIRAASNIKAAEDAHATSLEFSILNFHVKVEAPVGRELDLVTSDLERIITVASLASASFNLFCCSSV